MFSSPKDHQFQKIQSAFANSTGVTTDTRLASAGKLFFALKGENFDGNQYARQALEQGCCAVVIDDAAVANEIPEAILVEDGLSALQSLAQWHRRKWTCPVLGLTGSNGKTTTKELLKAVLRSHYPDVQATHGNLNNEIGVPLTLLGIGANPDMVIIEMGANAQGEIALLAEIAEPTHGIITNIGRAHLEGFGGVEGVIKGKSELFDFFRNQQNRGKQKGDEPVLFVNAAHAILIEQSQSIPRLMYGNPNHAPYALDVRNEKSLTWVDIENNQHGPLPCHIAGAHNFENMMTAAAVGLHFGVSSDQCSRALTEYLPDNNRSQWMRTESNNILLDAYNANPSSMESALAFFASSDNENAKPTGLVAILGDMGELGSYASAAHDEILNRAIDSGVEVLTVGPLFSSSASTRASVKAFDTTSDLISFLKANPMEGKQVLLKGSRSIALEKAIIAL